MEYKIIKQDKLWGVFKGSVVISQHTSLYDAYDMFCLLMGRENARVKIRKNLKN